MNPHGNNTTHYCKNRLQHVQQNDVYDMCFNFVVTLQSCPHMNYDQFKHIPHPQTFVWYMRMF